MRRSNGNLLLPGRTSGIWLLYVPGELGICWAGPPQGWAFWPLSGWGRENWTGKVRFQFFFRTPKSLTGINTCLDDMEEWGGGGKAFWSFEVIGALWTSKVLVRWCKIHRVIKVIKGICYIAKQIDQTHHFDKYWKRKQILKTRWDSATTWSGHLQLHALITFNSGLLFPLWRYIFGNVCPHLAFGDKQFHRQMSCDHELANEWAARGRKNASYIAITNT